MSVKIGIDLGTTNSVVAVVENGKARILDNREAAPQTPSVVGLRRRKRKGVVSEEIYVGAPAVANWDFAPRDTIVSVKRLMGRSYSDPEVKKVEKTFSYRVVEPSDGTSDSVRVVMGGREYSPVDISAMILSKLKDDACFRLNREVRHAVITVPAYFSQAQKAATREAGRKAGLEVLKVLDEPTAAAIAFGLDAGDEQEPKTVLVFDLGGGTFDISVLMMSGGVFAPLNLEGDMWLGGDNFDQVLVDYALKELQKEHGIDGRLDERFMVALKKAARSAKERLSSADTADLIVAGMLHDEDGNLVDLDVGLSRSDYEKMIEPLVARTSALAVKALENAEIDRGEVDYVLMAGNSSALPAVHRAMEEMFGRDKVLRNVHPKHCVALGAAMVAGMSEIKLGGIAPFHYGVQTFGDGFSVFIRKGDPFPTEEPQSLGFRTGVADQRILSIPVYGGDSLEKASANEKQGEAFAVLPAGLPSDTAVRIKLWLDGDGVFDLSASLDDGRALMPWIIHGEADARAIEAIERGEKLRAGNRNAFSAADLEEFEKLRDRAFNALQERDFGRALELAEEFEQAAGRAIAALERDGREARAENLSNFLRFVTGRYGWVLDGKEVYRLNKLAADAVASGDASGLEDEINRLPEIIRVCLGLRAAVIGRVRPYDGPAADRLLAEQERLEQSLKGRPPVEVMVRLGEFVQKVEKAVNAQPGAAGRTCEKCGALLRGSRRCPDCGADSWALHALSAGLK